MIIRKLIIKILKTRLSSLMIVVISFYFVGAMILSLVEPGFTTYGDGLWYAFTAMTTIGFGDLVATTVIGKIVTAILSIMAIFVFSFTAGVIASYYTEIYRTKTTDEFYELKDKLENLPNLSEKELEEISAKIKKIDFLKNTRNNKREKNEMK